MLRNFMKRAIELLQKRIEVKRGQLETLYDKLDTKDWRELQRVGDVTRSALRRLNHGVTYQVGSAAKMLYPASGMK